MAENAVQLDAVQANERKDKISDMTKTTDTTKTSLCTVFRRAASLFLIAVMISAMSLFSACSFLSSVDDSELKITDSGFIVLDENWFTY